MKFSEVEFKYRADDISFIDFTDFCIKRSPVKYLEASGYDYFYDSAKDDTGFYRLRVGLDMFQLTYKRKTTAANNFIRDEDNLDITPEKTSKAQIETHIGRHGYTFNTKIFKNCYIYQYENYTLVYYICYDDKLKEMGRFIEIEMSEHHPWENDTEAYNNLLVLEKLCKPMGITPQARVKRSLFEMFRKEENEK